MGTSVTSMIGPRLLLSCLLIAITKSSWMPEPDACTHAHQSDRTSCRGDWTTGGSGCSYCCVIVENHGDLCACFTERIAYREKDVCDRYTRFILMDTRSSGSS